MIKISLLIFSLFLLLYCFMPYFFQRSFIYFPDRSKPQRIEFAADDMQVIELHTKDGLILESWYKPAKDNNPTVLYLHGNGGHIGYRAKYARYFINEGLGILLLEYRGYGGNPGTPTEQGFYNDAHAALEFLKQKNVSSNQIILYGESLGGGVASELALHESFCAIILQSPFTSIHHLAKFHYPLLFVIPRDNFNTYDRIKKIYTPVLMTHGRQDRTVPYRVGERLFKQANEPKTWLELPFKTHNNMWDDNYMQSIMKFLNNSTNCFKKSL